MGSVLRNISISKIKKSGFIKNNFLKICLNKKKLKSIIMSMIKNLNIFFKLVFYDEILFEKKVS